eukprot:TRINITY_DN23543_c0_g1_i1.p1 TRINITY_DN23543_c0_g1~~TRINITY_DN23543_c0_g1_i1.p1  ORF type:complete len:299 (-),score=54.08 TRINITY_DN23543_c0_g1_i1:39-935(-)
MGRFENAYDFKKVHQLQIIRHIVQILAFVWLNGKIFGIAATGIIVPYLHVTQAPFSTAHGAFESLEYTITRGLFPLLVLGIIYLTAITVGRVFCGWACPFGLVQDILSYLPFKKQKLTPATVSQYKDIKWAILAFSLFSCFVVAWRRASNSFLETDPLGVFSDSPFSVISPSSTLFAYIPWMMIWNTNVLATAGLTGWIKMAILLGVLVPSVYVPRFFCRFLCPMGALLEPTFSYRALKIQTKLPREEMNNLLSDVCPMGVQLGKESTSDYIENPNCIHCGKCVTEEPTRIRQSFLES